MNPVQMQTNSPAMTGAGILEASKAIADGCEAMTHREAGEVLLTREIQAEAANEATVHLKRALSAVPQTAGLAVQTVFVADAAVVAVIVARPDFLLILNGSTMKVADPVNISRSNSCIPVRHS